MPSEQVRRQLESIVEELLGEPAEVKLERPRNSQHGDIATSAPLMLARRMGKPPRDVAALIVDRLDLQSAGIEKVEIAGPGFINFRLARSVLKEGLLNVVTADGDFGRKSAANRRRIQVEFVSANPTGPLHVAHGRGAALGDAVASLLEWTGHEVSREFYVNDAGVQVEKLALSLDARWRELAGEKTEVPEGGYRGDYLKQMASDVDVELGDQLRNATDEDRIQTLRHWAVKRLLAEQDDDLQAFRVTFDVFFRETALYEDGDIQETLRELKEHHLAFEADGALWLRTSEFGDDKDRVLVKRDGSYTYFLPDIAYHRNKARRGFDRVIDVWGADHHGYAARMLAALSALSLPDLLEVRIVQMVRIMRGDQEVRLSKRSGEFVTLRELFRETGVDVARYFFLMRRGDAQMVFDLDLALDHSEKNPVYKIQYAHARMASIFRKAGQETPADLAEIDLDLLKTPVEQDLIKQLARLPDVVERAAEARAPHIVCEYLEATAGMVNSWYHDGHPSRSPELSVLIDDVPLRQARLVLAHGIRIVLRNGLGLLGLHAPDRMEREVEA